MACTMIMEMVLYCIPAVGQSRYQDLLFDNCLLALRWSPGHKTKNVKMQYKKCIAIALPGMRMYAKLLMQSDSTQ